MDVGVAVAVAVARGQSNTAMWQAQVSRNNAFDNLRALGRIGGAKNTHLPPKPAHHEAKAEMQYIHCTWWWPDTILKFLHFEMYQQTNKKATGNLFPNWPECIGNHWLKMRKPRKAPSPCLQMRTEGASRSGGVPL